MARAKGTAAKTTTFRADVRGRVIRDTHISYQVVSTYTYSGSPTHRGVSISKTNSADWTSQLRRHSDQFPINQAAFALKHIAQWYVLRDQQQVVQFLQEHIYLVPLLFDAAQQISNYFPDSPLALEVVSDPEGNTQASLVVAITTLLGPDEAIGRLDRFDEVWWFGAVDRTRGKIIISLEYL